MRYWGYGVIIETDVPFQGFARVTDAPSKIQFWLASEPEWASRALELPRHLNPSCTLTNSSGAIVRPVFELGRGEFLLIRYADGTEFVVSSDGAKIFGRWRSSLTLQDALTYALGPILALALRCRGCVCLHSSAVELNGKAILFLGKAGAGKSTTAATMVCHGARLISDDISALCELDGRFHVHSGQSLVRIWPESADLLFGPHADLPLLTPNWDKRYYDPGLPELKATKESVAISRIYVLGSSDNFPPPDQFVSLASPRQSLICLLGNTHGNLFLDRSMRAAEFRVLTRLAESVPIIVLGERRRQIPLADLIQVITLPMST